MSNNDPFQPASSDPRADTYDPDASWFQSRNSNPPYEQSHVRMVFPQWFIHDISEFMYNDDTRTFTSVQQVLRNAMYHGFHHMSQLDYETSRLVQAWRTILDTEEATARLNANHKMIEGLGEMYRVARTTMERQDAADRIRQAAGNCTDPEIAEEILRIVR